MPAVIRKLLSPGLPLVGPELGVLPGLGPLYVAVAVAGDDGAVAAEELAEYVDGGGAPGEELLLGPEGLAGSDVEGLVPAVGGDELE